MTRTRTSSASAGLVLAVMPHASGRTWHAEVRDQHGHLAARCLHDHRTEAAAERCGAGIRTAIASPIAYPERKP